MSHQALSIGLRSLLTAQANLETIGHNVANANTPGYSRQDLLVSTVPGTNLRGLLIGGGLQADVVQRTVDGLLQGRLLRQSSSLGRLDARLGGLSDAELFVGSTGSNGLPARLSAFFTGFSTLATAPGDAILRATAVQASSDLAGNLNAMSTSLDGLRKDAVTEIGVTVKSINALAQKIGELNQKIGTTEAGVQSANDLRDQRDQALSQLSQLVDVQAIEEPGGALRVLISGHMLVSPSKTNQLVLQSDPSSSQAQVQLGVGGPSIHIVGGKLGGLFELLSDYLPDLQGQLDDFARNLVFEANKLHSTGLAASGPFDILTSANALVDVDGNGLIGNELLANAGLPFDVQSGTLYVNVTDTASGAMHKHAIAIDAKQTSVDDFRAALDAIPGLGTTLDGLGHLQIFADSGFAFDFSPRLETDPDAIGAFGGGAASLTSGSGPFAISGGDTLSIAGASGSYTITFNASDFVQNGAASADELAAAINADPQTAANGLVASAVDGRVVLQSQASGAGATFTLVGGSAAGALGWTAGTVVDGFDAAVAVEIAGVYGGDANGVWSFRPSGDGIVGTTPGLGVEVRDKNGVLVATLDVGAGYTPGDALELPDGVSVKFGYGQLSATHGDVFDLDVVADGDDTSVLAALGMNALFTGSNARDVAVRDELNDDPSLLATGLNGGNGDAGNVLRFLDLDTTGLAGFGGRTLSERFAEISSGLGQDIAATQSSRDAEQLLTDSLQARRDAVSGVNVDEELVKMIQQQQAYAAASQFLATVNEMQSELLQIL